MSAISESIREAALKWPVGYLGPVESHILDFAFLRLVVEPSLREMLIVNQVRGRTFMLLVAEALE